jgi:autotransporter-associated beta strand protein
MRPYDNGLVIFANANNTFGGGIEMNAGTLNVTNESALGAAGGTLKFNGGTLETSSDMTLNDRAITLTGAGTLNVDGGTTLTITNSISGSGSLTKLGLGTLVLPHANTLSGNFILGNQTANISGDRHRDGEFRRFRPDRQRGCVRHGTLSVRGAQIQAAVAGWS